MTQLFKPETFEPPRQTGHDNRSAAMQALGRLKQFRAGQIELKAQISRDLDCVFKFMEQVTA